MNHFLFILQAVMPVFLIAFLGIFLRFFRFFDETFVQCATKLVFNITLPILIFLNLISAEFTLTRNALMIGVAIAIPVIFYPLLWFVARHRIQKGKDLASFVQGSVKGNSAIVGLALIANVFGKQGVELTSAILAFLIPLDNFLSICMITASVHKWGFLQWKKLLGTVLANPLFIGAVLSLPFSLFKISLPQVLYKTCDFLASVTLPLALLSIGTILTVMDWKKYYKWVIFAVGIKLIVIPVFATLLAYAVGIRGKNLGVIFILFGSPTAFSSFIMAHAMGANEKLAGNIVLFSLLSSSVTITIGLTLLFQWGIF